MNRKYNNHNKHENKSSYIQKDVTKSDGNLSPCSQTQGRSNTGTPSPIFLFDPYPLSKPHELTETIIFLKHFWNLCLLKLVTKFSFFFRPVLECWSVHSHLNFDQYKRKINPVQNQQNIYLYLYYNRVHILFWFLLFSFILIEIQATVRVFSVTTGIFRKYPPKHDISA